MWEDICKDIDKGKRQIWKLPVIFLHTVIPIICLFISLAENGQNFGGATRIYTDFGGYWTSGTGQINPIFPDITHHLLGFTWNGTVYSTGIDDANLTAQGVNFSAQQYQAFPVRNIQAKSSGTYVGLGQL